MSAHDYDRSSSDDRKVVESRPKIRLWKQPAGTSTRMMRRAGKLLGLRLTISFEEIWIRCCGEARRSRLPTDVPRSGPSTGLERTLARLTRPIRFGPPNCSGRLGFN
jgi:hypothetical protein